VKSGARFGSPVRTASKQRSMSVEPKPLAESGIRRARSASVDYQPPPTAQRADKFAAKPRAFPPPSRPVAGPKLPFPLLPAREPPIPEDTETQDSCTEDTTGPNIAAAPSASPAKSFLRQPITGSRIPRIGAKPYARPATTASTSAKAQGGKTPGVMRRADLTVKSDAERAVSLWSISSWWGFLAGPLTITIISQGPSEWYQYRAEAGVALPAQMPTLLHPVQVRLFDYWWCYTN
jgi:hypothetical protein